MTIIEKSKKSAADNLFTLYREGLFYKCYNQDAMVFFKYVKAFKVTAKFIKNIKSEVLMLGFPIGTEGTQCICLEQIKTSLQASSFEIAADYVQFSVPGHLKSNYESFLAEVVEKRTSATAVTEEAARPVAEILVEMISQFDLANSSPMQGLAFIQDLKFQLKNSTTTGHGIL